MHELLVMVAYGGHLKPFSPALIPWPMTLLLFKSLILGRALSFTHLSYLSHARDIETAFALELLRKMI